MEAKNLRIGNWVKIPIKGSEIITPSYHAQIQSIGLFGMLEFLSTPKLNGVKWSVKSISPIKITDERLLKFGFSPTNNGNYEIEYMDIYSSSDGSYIFLFNGFSKTLNYVHELQNLFFALTNDELKYEK